MPAAKDSGSGVTTRAQDKASDEPAPALNSFRVELIFRTYRHKEDEGNVTRKSSLSRLLSIS
jgi:hypothetical protein